MSSERLSAFQTQQRQLDFASVKRAGPKGIYFTPTPRDPNVWQGVLFVRKGPYAPAILKFKIFLSADRPPVIAISTDIFHPLVTPLTTYTYTNSDTGADTVSATDEERLPPGGFSLRHGFPEWFGSSKLNAEAEEVQHNVQGDATTQDTHITETQKSSTILDTGVPSARCGAVDIARILYYMRSAFDSEVVLDKIPLDAAGNPGAWHAWQAHRAKVLGATSATRSDQSGLSSPLTIRQQPGGARRPGQWNWEGVWEERVKKGVHASISQSALYSSGHDTDLVGLATLMSAYHAHNMQINFLDVDPEMLEQAVAWKQNSEMEAEVIPA